MEKCKFGTLHRSVTTRVGDGDLISDLCVPGPTHYPLPSYLPAILASLKFSVSPNLP